MLPLPKKILVALCYGTDEASRKIIASMGDLSIMSSLLLNVIMGYIFEPPEAVLKEQWSKIAFNVALWGAVRDAY